MAKEGYGFLFPIADEKRTTNGPSMSGTAILNGREVKVAAWRKTSKNGTSYASLKFEDYEIEHAAPDASDDDIPF